MHYFETIDRVLRIHKLIKREATGTPDEFARKLDIKKRHLYNILEEFKDYGAAIRYSREKLSFYYENDFEISVTIKSRPKSNP